MEADRQVRVNGSPSGADKQLRIRIPIVSCGPRAWKFSGSYSTARKFNGNRKRS